MKVRHADTIDAQVVGYTGPRARPRNLAVVAAGEDRVRVTARLTAELAAHIGQALVDAPEAGAGSADQEIYTRLDTGLMVEVLAGSGRHGTLTVTRMR